MGQIGFMTINEDTRERKESDMKGRIRRALERSFRPEFLNRLDEIIFFSSLSPATIQEIVEIQLARVAKRMEVREIAIAFADEVKSMIAEKGYDTNYGARPLKRAIQSSILDPLAQEIISGKIVSGDSILVGAKDGKITISPHIKKLVPRHRERTHVKR
jgi:ATP-dependent Clp protease ATP-binding subunit ClpA